MYMKQISCLDRSYTQDFLLCKFKYFNIQRKKKKSETLLVLSISDK